MLSKPDVNQHFSNSHDDTPKARYREFSRLEETIPLYSKDWWLDAVCGRDNWDVRVVEEGRIIVAAWPFYKEQKKGLSLIHMPPFTPFGGIWIRSVQGQNYTSRIGYEILISSKLQEQLPPFDYLRQGFHYDFKNWMGFYWKGFSQTTRYSYVLEDISDVDKVFQGFHKNKRGNIRKAIKEVLDCVDLPVEQFYDFHKRALAKSGRKISYSFQQFDALYSAALANTAGRAIYAVDVLGNMHSALFFVWDRNSAYTIVSVVEPRFASSYSLSYLFYEAIKYSSRFVKRFDFEGSMINGVEIAYRYFGASQERYFIVSKIKSRLLRIAFFLKNEITSQR